MITTIKAIPSCDQVFLVWQLSAMIPDCLGFAVFREVDGQPPIAIHTWVGFENETHESGDHKRSTDWPIQKTSWTDYLAPVTGSLRYGVVPVIKQGTGTAPVDQTECVWSASVTLDQSEEPITAWFNRGTISAQWLARALKGKTPAKALETAIHTPGDPIRNFLAGRARERLIAHLDAVVNDPKRHLYAALFELNDCELVEKLGAIGPRAHLVLGNSDGGDTRNVRSTDASATLLLGKQVDLVRRTIAPGRFAHNKFVVFHDPAGIPERVWTGSINWTETGVCTQNSNGLDIKDPIAAAAFQAHWAALRGAGDTKIVENSPHAFATTVMKQPVSAHIWFTPVAKSVDLADATALINGAKTGIVFLMLNPGPAGLLGPIIERLSSLDAHYDPDLYIRGVLNNFPSRSKGSAQDAISLLTSEGKRQNFTADDLKSVLKPGGVDATADWWEKEVANTGKFMVAVHSKVIVIDPAGEDPIVLTGSHNFSSRASGDNDDNLVIMRGSNTLALSYAVNIIGIYNEYRFRAWRNTAAGQQDHGLKRDDQWLQARINQQWLKRETAFWM